MTDFRQGIKNMQEDGSLQPDATVRVLALHRASLEELADILRSKVREWELLDPEDTKLYSLGLRHAVDLLEEELQ